MLSAPYESLPFIGRIFPVPVLLNTPGFGLLTRTLFGLLPEWMLPQLLSF